MADERTLPELVAGLQAEEAALPATAVDGEYLERQQILARMTTAVPQLPSVVDEVQDDLFRYVELVRNGAGEAEFARKATRVRLAADALKVLQAIKPQPRRSFFERVENVVSSYYDKPNGKAA